MPEPMLHDARERIDAIDARIVGLLAERMAVVAEVVTLKRQHGVAANLPDRVEAVVAHVRGAAVDHGCPPDLAETVWRAMIAWTIAHEEAHLRA